MILANGRLGFPNSPKGLLNPVRTTRRICCPDYFRFRAHQRRNGDSETWSMMFMPENRLGLDGLLKLNSSVHPPWRPLWPVLQRLGGPGGGLVRMACRARIWDFISVGHRRCYESKCMCSYLHIRDCSLDLRHMAGNATASSRPFFVMRVLFDSSRAWAIQGK